jgi:hypothetical protein
MTEYTKNIRDDYGIPHTVNVSKVDGGTVGEKYKGAYWQVVILNHRGRVVFNAGGFPSGAMRVHWEASHEDVAYAAFEFAENLW